MQVSLTFEEAVFGVEKEIEFSRDETCSRCNGNGAEPGQNRKHGPRRHVTRDAKSRGWPRGWHRVSSGTGLLRPLPGKITHVSTPCLATEAARLPVLVSRAASSLAQEYGGTTE